MDTNYFSDITELFIKAKKAEKINVNPHSKAAIREMLAYKVDEMKSAEEAPTGNFFNKWKFQLIGVPASVFAVFLLVFAFQNLAITMPKEDFAPKTNDKSSTEQNEEEVVKDIPVIEEVETPKPKPELMVIDYSETSQPTTTTQPKTGGGTTYTQPVNNPTTVPAATVQTFKPYIAPVQQPTVEENSSSSSSSSSSNNSTPSTGGGSISSYTPTTTPDPDPVPEAITPTESTYTPPTTNYTPQPNEPSYDIYTPTTSNGYTLINQEIDIDTNVHTIPAPNVDIPQYEINPETVNDMMDGSIPLPKTPEVNENEGSVNEFRDPFTPLVTEFDTGALNTIEKPDTLDNVNVHYLNRDQAAVEVVDNNSTRWYMFETVNGTWTVTQKFD